MHEYHDTFQTFPSETTPSSAKNSSTQVCMPSLYSAILPFVEQQNLEGVSADDVPAVRMFLCPSRRGTSVGGKRDYGYASSAAKGAAGPSILDAETEVTATLVTNNNGTSETYLLTHLWMAPKTYFDGSDASDRGWMTKYNSRTSTSALKADRDSTGDTTYLGGPHPGTVPTVFADGHVESLSYHTPNFGKGWAYINGFNKNSPPPSPVSYTCLGCPKTCGCGCPASRVASGKYTKQDLMALLTEMGDQGPLTSQQASLLQKIDPTDYQNYLKDLQQWQQNVQSMGKAGNTAQMTPQQLQYWNQYEQQQAAQQAALQQQAMQQSAIALGKAGNTSQMTPQQLQYWNQYQQQQATAQMQQQAVQLGNSGNLSQMTPQQQQYWNQYTVQQGMGGKPLNAQQQQYYDQWTQNAIQNGSAGKPLDSQSQTYYNSYAQGIVKQVNSGVPLSSLPSEQQQVYNQYTQAQLAAQQAAQQSLQNSIKNVVSGLPVSSTSCTCPGCPTLTTSP